MTLRLMGSSIHTKPGSKGPGGVIQSICLLQARVWLPCTVSQGPQRRNPLKHFASVQSQRAPFSSGMIAIMEYNTPDPKGFLAAHAKMKLCEGRRLPHSHCSSNPFASGAYSGLHPTQEIEEHHRCPQGRVERSNEVSRRWDDRY